MVTGQGNIKSNLHKYKILDSPMCSCKNGEQRIDHIILDFKLLDQERDSLKAAALRTENWSVSKNELVTEFNKNFTKLTNNCIINTSAVACWYKNRLLMFKTVQKVTQPVHCPPFKKVCRASPSLCFISVNILDLSALQSYKQYIYIFIFVLREAMIQGL
jgi:hypothetical protein